MFGRLEVVVDGYAPIEDHADMMEKLSDLKEADFHSSAPGDEIGETENLIADAGGRIRYGELDMGGFLGIGHEHVLVPAD